jgi:hypothetical protein
MAEPPSNHFYVGRRILLDNEEWMITACSFIFDTAILRRVADIQNPQVGYHGKSRTLDFDKIPLGSIEGVGEMGADG